MSVYVNMGIECDQAYCTEEWEGNPSEHWRRMVTDARKAGWLISRDGSTTYCPAHRTVAQRIAAERDNREAMAW